jgi:hypothetical protein
MMGPSFFSSGRPPGEEDPECAGIDGEGEFNRFADLPGRVSNLAAEGDFREIQLCPGAYVQKKISRQFLLISFFDPGDARRVIPHPRLTDGADEIFQIPIGVRSVYVDLPVVPGGNFRGSKGWGDHRDCLGGFRRLAGGSARRFFRGCASHTQGNRPEKSQRLQRGSVQGFDLRKRPKNRQGKP